MFENLLDLDESVFLALNGLGDSRFDIFWLFITNKFLNVFIYLILVIYFYKNNSLKYSLYLVLTVSILILFTDQFTNLIKYSISRPRPCHEESLYGLVRLVKPTCGGAFGYFSGHASNSFALAVLFSGILSSKFKYISVYLIIFASFVAYSRIYIGVHYPLDVISGAIIGSIFGYLVLIIWNNLISIKNNY